MKVPPRGCARAASLLLPFLPGGVAALAAQVEPRPVLAIGHVVSPRQELGTRHPAAAQMIEQGIAWLLAHQDKDGRWNADEFMLHDGDKATDGKGRGTQDVAITGLVLLALSREGVARRSDVHYGALVRGAHWLALQQGENGVFGSNSAQDFIYGQAIATLGLWAATAATGSAEARTAAERGYAYLEAHRNPYAVWRYQPRDNDNDTSVTTWATLAYLAAHEQGHKVNRQAFALIAMWLDQVTDEQGRAGYTRKGEPSSRNMRNAARFPPTHGEAMTAAGLLCRTGMGQSEESHPITAQSAALLLEKAPTWAAEDGHVDHCYWFFATEALRHFGGEGRSTWANALVPALQQGMRRDGAYAGSWDPVDPWGEDGGRLYATALSVLALQGLYPLGLPAEAGADRKQR